MVDFKGVNFEGHLDLPVHAANTTGCAGCGRPLIEAALVDIVPARCLAPDEFFVGFEFHEADGTVAFDWLAVAILCLARGGFHAAQGRSMVHFAELLAKDTCEPFSEWMFRSTLTEDRKAS